jgi:protein MpaA
VILGFSVEGRPIEAERLGPDGLTLLVFGAIHGDEPGSAELCVRFLERLSRRAPPVGVVVAPVVNPDGLERNRKDNARGVDLNRNFPAANWQLAHPPGYHSGAQPLSEPESAALAGLIDAVRPAALVAVHQPFRCVNWDGPARVLAARMSAASGFPMRESVGYPTPGSFGSCYGVDRGLPVVTLELPRPVEDADFDACLRALDCAILWIGSGAER